MRRCLFRNNSEGSSASLTVEQQHQNAHWECCHQPSPTNTRIMKQHDEQEWNKFHNKYHSPKYSFSMENAELCRRMRRLFWKTSR
mmetsp:Transcript_22233/g.48286  ORF Transcript_22233/g.48286 Transcript_22233/m.48286 type:complete len:85 (+) Transcript_22233:77-331(+)